MGEEQTMEFLSILPNLSIGVVSVLGLVYLAVRLSEKQEKAHQSFIEHLNSVRKAHEAAMQERETEIRKVEREVRTEITATLVAATSTNKEAAKVMERVIAHLDKH